MIRLAVLFVMMVGFSHAQAADPPLAKQSSISFGNPFTQSPERLSAQWEALSQEQQKTILRYLVGKLGLSDTGVIQLSGVYQQATKEHPKKVVYHFQQADLHGSRLFWSVLVDPDEQTAQLLFHINSHRDIGKSVSFAGPDSGKAD